jgi:hypothetical protein
LENVFVDASSAALPFSPSGALRLRPGLHRLDFDFGFGPENPGGSIKLRCQLEGIDDRWQETERGMGLVCQALDRDNRVISQSRFPFIGTSGGWDTALEDSAMSRRVEPVYVPVGTTALRLSLNSGSPDTTGFVTVDRFALTAPGQPETSLWKNGSIALKVGDAMAAIPRSRASSFDRGQVSSLWSMATSSTMVNGHPCKPSRPSAAVSSPCRGKKLTT